MCIHPLNPDIHPDPLVNITSGSIAPSKINIDQAVSIGYNQLIYFEKTLLTVFWHGDLYIKLSNIWQHPRRRFPSAQGLFMIHS